MKYLALDVGSSYIKYTVLDIDNRRIGVIHRCCAPEPKIRSATRYEISPEDIWDLVERVIIQSVFQEDDLAGIVFSTQMHGFILADENKVPLTPYISWQDSRCLEMHEGVDWLSRLAGLGCAEEMEEAGVGLKPNISMCNLYTVMQENDFSGKQVHFCTLGSYLIWKLTGHNICHITNGAPTGLINIVNGDWNRRLIEKLGYENIVFPGVEKELRPCGICHIEGRAITVFPDLGDHQVCVLGSHVRQDDEINISIGTAGLLSIISKDYQWRSGEVRPYFDGMYLNTQRGLFGGRDLEVLVNFFGDVIRRVTGADDYQLDIWKAISRVAEKDDDGSSQLEIESNFYKNGSISKITNANFTFVDLMDAIYRKVASEYHTALMEIMPAGKRYRGIVFSGGAVRKTHWLKKAIAEELGCQWREVQMEDEAIQGLFRVALVCSGACQTLDDTGEYI